jgi:GntR family transcriptional regulator
MIKAPLPLPRYHQIYLVLRERLASGELAPGRPLPGELELARAYGVSRVTIRAALGRLAKEQLVRRQRGRGTFARRAATPRRDRLSGFFENVLMHGLRTAVRIVELSEIAAPAEVAEALGLAQGARVQKAIRVRSYRGGPVSIITTYVPADVARGFGRRELAAKPMLQLLEEAGVKVSEGEQTISAQLADHLAAEALEVGVGSPLLSVRRIVYGPKRRPVQYLLGLYRPDRYEYRMHLSRSGATPRIWVPS